MLCRVADASSIHHLTTSFSNRGVAFGSCKPSGRPPSRFPRHGPPVTEAQPSLAALSQACWSPVARIPDYLRHFTTFRLKQLGTSNPCSPSNGVSHFQALIIWPRFISMARLLWAKDRLARGTHNSKGRGTCDRVLVSSRLLCVAFFQVLDN